MCCFVVLSVVGMWLCVFVDVVCVYVLVVWCVCLFARLFVCVCACLFVCVMV